MTPKIGASTCMAAAVLALAACSHSSGARVARANNAPSERSSSSTSAHSGAPADPVASYLAGQRAFVRCVRKHGVFIPDPDSKGNINGPSSLKLNTRYLNASRACAGLQKPVPASIDYPPLTTAQFLAAKRYAACMRSHGSPTYPDPVRDTDPNVPDAAAYYARLRAAGSNPTNAYEAALSTCEKLVYHVSGAGKG